ncbi:MAG: DUF202 domain-containing protein, partial [Rubrobacter sp.]|nr:DUF202 domain-containing protein [Rubrobacter sp.]
MKFFGNGGPTGAYRPSRDAEVREHLANERTLLAWVRTGVGLISVGFVVERAGALAPRPPAAGRRCRPQSSLASRWSPWGVSRSS